MHRREQFVLQELITGQARLKSSLNPTKHSLKHSLKAVAKYRLFSSRWCISAHSQSPKVQCTPGGTVAPLAMRRALSISFPLAA